MFLIGCWRISTYEKVVSRPNIPNKMNHTMWKSMKNCAPKWCCKLCAFLLKITCAFWKMWVFFVYSFFDSIKFMSLNTCMCFFVISVVCCLQGLLVDLQGEGVSVRLAPGSPHSGAGRLRLHLGFPQLPLVLPRTLSSPSQQGRPNTR